MKTLKMIGVLIVLLLVLGFVVKIKSDAINSDTSNSDGDNSSVVQARFYCPHDSFIDAEFLNSKDAGKDSVNLNLSDGRKYSLPIAISASGARYANKDESFVFWNKGDNATIIENGVETFGDCSMASKTTDSSAVIDKVTIMVPQDLEAYDTAMNKYIFDGGENPAETLPFIKKVVTVASTKDLIKASAQASADIVLTQGGKTASKIEYFRIVDGTAYIMLHIQFDGWAGSTASFTKIKPLIENTLLQFPEIKAVKFELAQGDTRELIK